MSRALIAKQLGLSVKEARAVASPLPRARATRPRKAAKRAKPDLVTSTSYDPRSSIYRDLTHDMDRICCYLPEPPSANRWWRNVKGRMVLSRQARAYKADVAKLAQASTVTPYDGPVEVRMIWWRSRRAGDLDKRLGVALDALQGIAYHNDGQIVRIDAERHDAPNAPHPMVIHVLSRTPRSA